MTGTNHETILQEILQSNPDWKNARLESMKELPGEMSPRRYFRLHFSSGPQKTALLVIGAGRMSKLGGGPSGLNQDWAFFELANFFTKHGIRAPILYGEALSKHSALLLEDFGSRSLGEALREPAPQGNREQLFGYFQKAIENIALFQQLPSQECPLLGQRGPDFVMYRQEISEILEHGLRPQGIRQSEESQLCLFFDAVSQAVLTHERRPSHYDYHSYNIHILEGGALGIIDFQDACFLSPLRDVVSLLNDRGTDEALGRDDHARLLAYAKATLGKGIPFEQWYDDYLLHWDCRVSGRFLFLAREYARSDYLRWLPSTLRRLLRTLERVEGRYPGAMELHGLIKKYMGASLA